jgi:hypothetical protein
MFGMRRKSRTERVAEEAWDTLVSAMDSAGDTARAVGRRTKDSAITAGKRTSDIASDLVDKAGDRVAPVAEEAWVRASNAFDALAGRKPKRSWGWIVVGVLGGIAVGWAAAASAPKAIQSAMDRYHDEDEGEFDPAPAGPTTRVSTGTPVTPVTPPGV